MGIVYLGRSPDGRRAAVKVIKADHADNPAIQEMFEREIRLAQRVAGIGTVQVLDAGTDTDAGQPYYATEFVDGPTLEEDILRNGPMGPARLERLAAAVATALTRIHRARAVHLDLKPSNVLMSADGPLLIDFGISRSFTTLHVARPKPGTPAFMAPEQARGDSTESVGPATDIFAWGGLVIYAATGRPPFGHGSTEAQLYRAIHEKPNLAGVPEPLRPLVASAMDKDPNRRPAAASLYLGLLEATGPANDDELAAFEDDSPPAAAKRYLEVHRPAQPRSQVPDTPSEPVPLNSVERPVHLTNDEHAQRLATPTPMPAEPKNATGARRSTIPEPQQPAAASAPDAAAPLLPPPTPTPASFIEASRSGLQEQPLIPARPAEGAVAPLFRQPAERAPRTHPPDGQHGSPATTDRSTGATDRDGDAKPPAVQRSPSRRPEGGAPTSAGSPSAGPGRRPLGGSRADARAVRPAGRKTRRRGRPPRWLLVLTGSVGLVAVTVAAVLLNALNGGTPGGAGTPKPSTTAATNGTAPAPEVTASQSPEKRWKTVLAELDAARGRAFERVDESALADVYEVGTAIYALELAQLRQVAGQDAHASGLSLTVLDLHIEEQTSDRVVLRVTEQLGAYEVLDAHGNVLLRKEQAAAERHDVTLVRTAAGWRISDRVITP